MYSKSNFFSMKTVRMYSESNFFSMKTVRMYSAHHWKNDSVQFIKLAQYKVLKLCSASNWLDIKPIEIGNEFPKFHKRPIFDDLIVSDRNILCFRHLVLLVLN
jgi:hypothetical protein